MTKSNDAIYEELKNEIVKLKIKPGAVLSEIDIAKRFGVSRTPIRDVFKKLEADGLLEIVSQKGTYVKKINIDEVNEMMYIREKVELAVLKEVMEVANIGQINLLNLFLVEQKDIIENTPDELRAEKFLENDNKFHEYIFRIAGKEGVWRLLYQFRPAFNRFRVVTNLRKTDDLIELYENHAAILECLKNKDYERINDVISNHAYHGLNGIDAVFDKHRDYFE
jgi:DNA-binding GntR family transcriptional regulator